MLLMLTPLMIEGRLNPEAVLEQSRLGEFADTLVRHKAVVETHLGIEVRRDAQNKPVQQLGRILRLLGLKLEPLDTKKQGGKKTYQYRLEPEAGCLAAPSPKTRMTKVPTGITED
jgi:hypothetical protein